MWLERRCPLNPEAGMSLRNLLYRSLVELSQAILPNQLLSHHELLASQYSISLPLKQVETVFPSPKP